MLNPPSIACVCNPVKKKALFKVTFRIRDITINVQKHCITIVDVQYIIVLFGTTVGRNKSDITCKFV